MSVISTDGKYVRGGACNNCGDCCAGCDYLIYIASKALKINTTIVPAVDFYTQCTIRNTPLAPAYTTCFLAKGCLTFPMHPYSTPKRCGFTWTLKP